MRYHYTIARGILRFIQLPVITRFRGCQMDPAALRVFEDILYKHNSLQIPDDVRRRIGQKKREQLNSNNPNGIPTQTKKENHKVGAQAHLERARVQLKHRLNEVRLTPDEEVAA